MRWWPSVLKEAHLAEVADRRALWLTLFWYSPVLISELGLVPPLTSVDSIEVLIHAFIVCDIRKQLMTHRPCNLR